MFNLTRNKLRVIEEYLCRDFAGWCIIIRFREIYQFRHRSWTPVRETCSRKFSEKRRGDTVVDDGSRENRSA